MQYKDENGVNEPSRRRLLKGIGALALAGSCPVAHAQKTQSAPGTLSPDARMRNSRFMVSIRQGS
ncbi:putative peroxidase [Escherichia coli]|uniref:Putative peroxidase n=1 Tax=Escherichia coli TaxID=562 RepID=A0A376P4L1_ECOLX|nr:putative peroxidase [Escherichia coli]